MLVTLVLGVWKRGLVEAAGQVEVERVEDEETEGGGRLNWLVKCADGEERLLVLTGVLMSEEGPVWAMEPVNTGQEVEGVEEVADRGSLNSLDKRADSEEELVMVMGVGMPEVVPVLMGPVGTGWVEIE